ncbi:MAG: hypothetical protein DCC68_20300 [Planctomycetota bacterium]|nr:MAG: hypothetical protein DCC68_20300 [Planctomycetota bacterium]
MGLGLYLFAIARDGAPISPVDLDRIGEEFLAAIPDESLREFVSFSRDDERVYVALHPAEENVELWFNDGKLWCSAKTSSCGPGYHAYLVDILRRLADRMRLEWIIDEEQESLDETGYWTNQDFEDMQTEMAWLFRAIAKPCSDDDKSRIMLSMSIGYPSVANMKGFAMTSMGFRSLSWLRDIAASTDPPIHAAAGHFSWWNRGLDELFWKRYALVLCWTELNWNVPQNDKERRRYERVLTCFRRARACDPSVTLPEDEIAEIEQLLTEYAECDETLASDTSRIGFLRHVVRRALPGQWSVAVPGWWHCDWEDDNTTFVCWGDRVTVRVSSFVYNAEPKKSPLEAVGKVPLAEDFLEVIDDRDANPPGWATISLASEEGDGYWKLSGEKGKTNGLAIVTICFDEISDRDRALETWRSLMYTGKD